MKSASNTLPDQPPNDVTAGIDWARDDHAVCIVDDRGRQIADTMVEHTAAGLRDLVTFLARHRNLSSQMRQLGSVHLGVGLGLVDPGLGRHDRRVRSVAEPLGVGVVGGGEGVLPVLVDRVGGAEVH